MRAWAGVLLLVSSVAAAYGLGLSGLRALVYESGPITLLLVGVRVTETPSEWPGMGRALQNVGEVM